MNRRSAMVVAAGLIVALAAGAYALSLGSTGPTAAAAARTTHRHKPIVRTIRRTVTVHQKAPASTHGVVTAAPAPSMVAPVSGSSYEGSYGEPEDTGGASDDGAFSGGGSSSSFDD